MLSVIIIDYNSFKKTIEYINHLSSSFKNIKDEIHYIIVDNYINSNAEEYVRNEYNGEELVIDEFKYLRFTCQNVLIYYIRAKSNLGYAKGNNYGSKFAKILFNDKYILFSNNDLIVKTKIDMEKIDELFNKDKYIGVIGPRILGLDNNPQSPNKEVKAFEELVIAPFILPPFSRKGDLDYSNESKYCYRVSGCFMFVRTSIFFEIGGFDPNTFMFCEEMILSEKLMQKGYKTFFWNDCILIHNHGETVRSNTTYLQADRWLRDSQLYFFKKYREVNNITFILGNISFKIFTIRKIIRHYIKKLLIKKGSRK